MGLDDEGLSTDEQSLAAELAGLGASPSPESRAAIMKAVRRSHPAMRSFNRPHRLVLSAAAALVLLVSSTVGVFAASAEALPSSPAYPVRTFAEQCRIALATPAQREQLRISFADARIAQARATLSHGQRSDAAALLRDSRNYLRQTQEDLGSVPAGQQGQVENQLNQAQANENQAESQLNQGETQTNNG